MVLLGYLPSEEPCAPISLVDAFFEGMDSENWEARVEAWRYSFAIELCAGGEGEGAYVGYLALNANIAAFAAAVLAGQIDLLAPQCRARLGYGVPIHE